MEQIIIEEDSPYCMTERQLIKNNKKHNFGRINTQLYAAFVAWLGAFVWGSSIGYPCAQGYNIIKDNDNNVEGKKEYLTKLASVLPFGVVCGLIPINYMMHDKGRKKIIKLFSPCFIFCFCLELFPSINIFTALVAIFFKGFFGVVYFIPGEILLAESLDNILGKYAISIFEVFIISGICLIHSLAVQWKPKYISLLCIGLSAIHYVLLLKLPESPVILYRTSEKAAQRAIIWYRGGDNIYMDMNKLSKDMNYHIVHKTVANSEYILTHKTVVIALSRIVLLTFFQCNTGYYIYIFHTFKMWHPKSVFSFMLDDTFIALCLLLSSILKVFQHVTARRGIRIPLIVSSTLVSAQLALLTLYLKFHKMFDLSFGFPIPLALVGLGIFFSDIGLNRYPHLLVNEYLPYQVLSLARCLQQLAFWIFVSLNVYIFGYANTYFPSYTIFACYSIISLCGTFFVIDYIVDVKGKSLGQIQVELGGNPVGNRGAVHRREIV